MCLYPILVRNRKYTENKKNGGIIPAIKDIRTLYAPTACGKCIECKKTKARDWQIRLSEEIKTSKNAKFVTLTLSNQSYAELTKQVQKKQEQKIKKLKSKATFANKYTHEINREKAKQIGYKLDNQIAKEAVRLFLERHRKWRKTSIKHWFITELGHQGTENIHLHGIIWTDTDLHKIERLWKYGYMWKGKPILQKNNNVIKHTLQNYVNETTIGYITKYVTKTDQKHKYYQPIILTSPLIGSNYTKTKTAKINRYNGINTNESYRTRTGHKIKLPIYYRNKLYTEEERENLWLIKLNEETRYVMGNKIDISKTDEQYLRALEQARKTNTELGYQSNYIDYDQKAYEIQTRIIQQQTRIAKANI